MTAESRAFRLFFCLACTSFLTACSMFASSPDSSGYAPSRRMLQAQREQSLQADWRGRPYANLLENFGTPQMMMSVPGRRHFQTSVAVYGVTDNLSQCIDAFTLLVLNSGEVIIADYFCR
jgi:hypothetical protein